MESLVERGFSGSVLVACGERVLFQGAYGLPPQGRHTPSYWIASVTKQFTAAAVLALVENGQLSLEDRLDRFFPFVPGDKAAITLLQLATHQSGLPQTYAADGHNDREEAARAIFSQTLSSTPGTQFEYSNDNYALLAMVVEISSGQTIDDFITERLVRPAGLTDTGFWPDDGTAFVPPRLAPPPPELAGPNWGMRGSDGMRTSVRDLLTWVRALDSGAVLSQNSVRQLYGPHLYDVSSRNGDDVGMGWFWTTDERGRRWLWTRGSEDTGPSAILYRHWGTPLTIIAASNAGPAESEGPVWSRQARDALMQIYDAESCDEEAG